MALKRVALPGKEAPVDVRARGPRPAVHRAGHAGGAAGAAGARTRAAVGAATPTMGVTAAPSSAGTGTGAGPCAGAFAGGAPAPAAAAARARTGASFTAATAAAAAPESATTAATVVTATGGTATADGSSAAAVSAAAAAGAATAAATAVKGSSRSAATAARTAALTAASSSSGRRAVDGDVGAAHVEGGGADVHHGLPDADDGLSEFNAGVEVQPHAAERHFGVSQVHNGCRHRQREAAGSSAICQTVVDTRTHTHTDVVRVPTTASHSTTLCIDSAQYTHHHAAPGNGANDEESAVNRRRRCGETEATWPPGRDGLPAHHQTPPRPLLTAHCVKTGMKSALCGCGDEKPSQKMLKMGSGGNGSQANSSVAPLHVRQINVNGIFLSIQITSGVASGCAAGKAAVEALLGTFRFTKRPP